MLNFLGGGYTVYEIRCALVFVVYALWRMYCSMSVPMFQPVYTCGDHDVLYFGLLWITNIVPGGASDAWL